MRLSTRHLLGLLLGLATAGASLAQGTAPQPRHGGTLIAAIHPAPAQLNASFHNQYANAAVSANIFDGLVTYDDQQNLLPVLATSWHVSSDGLTLTFKLRQGVKWHDDQPFTSADVKYSFLEVLKKVHPRGRITFAAIQDIDTPDAHTAVFRLSRPAPVILNALNVAEATILPRHLYEGTDVRNNPHNSKPVGTGPFRFKEWKKGQYVELERNPEYRDKGKPYLDRVIFRQIADPASRAAALEAGEIQYLPYAGVPFADVARLRQLPHIAFDTRGYAGNSQINYLALNLRNPILARPLVRQALAHAVDKQGLIDTVWYGLSEPADGPVPRTLARYYTDDKPRYPFDLKKAGQLLDEAGLPRQTNGFRFSLDLDLSPSADSFVQAGEYLRQNLRKVGIEVRPRSHEQSAYIRKIWTDYNFDLILNGFSTLFDPEMGLSALYWSKAASRGVPYVTAGGYKNEALDQVVERFQSELDPARRIGQFQEFQRIAMRDLPMIPLLNSPFFTLHNKKVNGLDFRPHGARSSLAEVWISP